MDFAFAFVVLAAIGVSFAFGWLGVERWLDYRREARAWREFDQRRRYLHAILAADREESLAKKRVR